MAVTNNASPLSRPGQINGTGDARALFLKKFSGEVLTAFTQENVMMDKHRVRTITQGKSAQFILTGQASTKYHVAGESIVEEQNAYLNNIKAGERTISADSLLTSAVFLDRLEDAMSQYDARSVYTKEMGLSLARVLDKRLQRVLIQAARTATAVPTGTPLGYSYTGNVNRSTARNALFRNNDLVASGSVGGNALIAALFGAAQFMDEQNVPREGRYALISPGQWYALIQQKDLVHRDLAAENGSFARGEVYQCAGIQLVKTNNLPGASFTVADGGGAGAGSDGTYNDYSADTTLTCGIVFQREAIGTVKLLDLRTEMEWQIERQGWLMVSSYAMGHGVLRPACAIELEKAS